MKPKLIIDWSTGLLLLLLAGCGKETFDAKSSGDTYEYAYTLKRFSQYDTIVHASHISQKYKFVHGASNEFRSGYTCSFFINDELCVNLLLTKRKYVDENGSGSDLNNYTDSDISGKGFTTEYYRSSMPQNLRSLQILDFPFPGWNRFIKTDD